MNTVLKGSDKVFSFWALGRIEKRNLDFVSARAHAMRWGKRGVHFVRVKQPNGHVVFEMQHGQITIDSSTLRKS